MLKAMDSRIVVSEFEHQLRYYSHFRILLAMDKIVPLLFFLKDGFGI